MNDVDERGFTALHAACSGGSLAAVQYLIEQLHVDVNTGVASVAACDGVGDGVGTVAGVDAVSAASASSVRVCASLTSTPPLVVAAAAGADAVVEYLIPRADIDRADA